MKLLADSMLGTLGRWLRLLGYDTLIAGSHQPDSELARLARAEGRVVLTRDRELAARRGVRSLLILADDLDEQLIQAARELPLPPQQPGSRCLHCNGLLEPAGHDEVAGDVPAYVLQTQAAFRRCSGCGRVYWKGTHWPDIEAKEAMLASVAGVASRPDSAT
jgi:uncharacterized protein with PIN domain